MSRTHLVAFSLSILLVLSGLTCPPNGNPPGTATPTATLASIDGASGFVIDPLRGKAYVGMGRQLRRIDLGARAFEPLTAPEGSFYVIDAEDPLIGEINPSSGQVIRYIPYQRGAPNAGIPTSLEFDPVSQRLYTIDIASVGSLPTLFAIDPVNGARTQVGQTGLSSAMHQAFSLARDPTSGMLYTVNVTDTLWRIDPNTGTAVEVSGQYIGFTNIQAMSFSPSGVLYGVQLTNAPNPLLTIDTTTGIATQIGEIPLTYAVGMLAFKPDGTLWTVDGPRDALIQIDPVNGAIVQEFATLKRTRPSFTTFYFDVNEGLAFAKPAGGEASIFSDSDIDAVGLDADGGILTTAGNTLFAFDNQMVIRDAESNLGGLKRFESVQLNPANGKLFVRDGIQSAVYEIDPADLSTERELQYRTPTGFYGVPRQPDMGVDTQSGKLYIATDTRLYRIDLLTGNAEDPMIEGDVQAVIVDTARRRLHLNMKLGSVDANGSSCSSIRTLNLDTLELVKETCAGVQIFDIAFDAQRNRLAVNVRLVIPGFDTQIHVYDLATLARLPYHIAIDASESIGETSNPFDARLAIDVDRNQLLVGYRGENPRIEFFNLPD